MTNETKSTRSFQFFWSFSNRSIFTLYERFEMNSIRFRKICESRSKCDSMIDSSQISSCSVNLSIRWVVINVRSMMFAVMRFFHVINFLNNVNVKSCFFIMFKSSFVATCCVDLDESFQKKWWRLKFSNKMWWFVNASIKDFFVFENVNELSRDE
jgi:hypothetical protein